MNILILSHKLNGRNIMRISCPHEIHEKSFVINLPESILNSITWYWYWRVWTWLLLPVVLYPKKFASQHTHARMYRWLWDPKVKRRSGQEITWPPVHALENPSLWCTKHIRCRDKCDSGRPTTINKLVPCMSETEQKRDKKKIMAWPGILILSRQSIPGEGGG